MRRKIATSLAVMALFLSSTAAGDDVLKSNGTEVRVNQVVAHGDLVTGRIENHSSLLVRNPKILVRHSWLWENEFQPGRDSPGRSEIIAITADIPPGDSFTFTHELPRGPSPDANGRFFTSAEIVGFEQVGRRPVASSIR